MKLWLCHTFFSTCCWGDAVNFRFKPQPQEASSGGAQSAAPAPVPVPAVEVIQLLLRKPDLFEKYVFLVKVGKSDNNEIIIMSYTFFNMLFGFLQGDEDWPWSIESYWNAKGDAAVQTEMLPEGLWRFQWENGSWDYNRQRCINRTCSDSCQCLFDTMEWWN